MRRAFFWAAEETCTGAQCLVAWKNVCKPKNCGGLGLKNLYKQNNCLLMKFAVKALLPNTTPWLDWIALQHPNALIAPQNSHSFIGRTINQQLPALHAISFVLTHFGTNTYFWLDTWIDQKPLATLFPCLYSHTTLPLARVATIFNYGLDSILRNRLTSNAAAELCSVLSLLQDFQVSPGPDERYLNGCLGFSTRAAYSLTMADDSAHEMHAIPIWSSCVPNRVKIFAWLLFRDRLNSKSNLLRKFVVTDSLCPRYGFDGETHSHIFITCPLAQRIWQRIGICPSATIDGLWDCRLPSQLDAAIWHSILLIILWKIWDSRNAMTFKQQNHCSTLTLKRIIDDLMLWMHRMKKTEHKQAASSWRSHLLSRLHVPM